MYLEGHLRDNDCEHAGPIKSELVSIQAKRRRTFHHIASNVVQRAVARAAHPEVGRVKRADDAGGVFALRAQNIEVIRISVDNHRIVSAGRKVVRSYLADAEPDGTDLPL